MGKIDATTPGKRLALVIGANTTGSILLSPLQSALDDATAMADVLQNHCGFTLCAPPLLGEQATSETIRKAVRTLARDRTDDDFLLLYFSGHGQPMTVEVGRHAIYLGSSDFNEQDVEDEEGSHVSFQWLREWLYERTQAGRVLLILDCCFSGDMGRTAPDHYLEELRKRINYYFEGPGADSRARSGGLRLALTATGHMSTAAEDKGQGLMTSFLLSALQGQITDVLEVEQQGAVSLQRLHRYLELVMPLKQKPSLTGDYAGRSCILAHYPERAVQLQRTTRVPSAEQPVTYIPFPRDPLFQERPGEFERLEGLLSRAGTDQMPIHLGLVGVIGMGGVGKTQLAVELAYRFLDQQRFRDGIFWMSAVGTSRAEWQRHLADLAFQTGYLPPDDDLASSENEARRARHFVRYLASHAEALLVLDNIEDPTLINTLLPAIAGGDLQCTLLYTSRINQPLSHGTLYPVEQLPELAALQVLLQATRSTLLAETLEGSQSAEACAARKVCQCVGYLPLALVHLRGLLAQDRSLSLMRLVGALQQRGVLNVAKAVTTTFRLSWERVRTDEARCLFQLAAYFPEATPIPLWLLGLAAGLGETSDILEPLGQARLHLQELSLVEELSGQLARLHPLVREFGRELVREAGKQGEDMLNEARLRLKEVCTLNWLEQRARREGYWTLLEQVRAMRAYLDLLSSGESARPTSVHTLEHWLDRESYLLANTAWWPDKLPALFYQQLFNRAVEAAQPLKAGKPPVRWLRLMRSTNTEDPGLLRIFAGHTSLVNSVAFSPDGRQVLTGSEDGTARLWDRDTGRELVRLEGHTSSVYSVAFSPDGRQALTGSADRTTRLWDSGTGRELVRLEGHTSLVYSVAFSPDGRQVLTGSADRTTRLWDSGTGRELACLKGHTSSVYSVVFSPDGCRVLTGSDDRTARLWDSSTGRELARLIGHTSSVYSVAFSPDGRQVLTGSFDGTARLWDRDMGWELVRFDGHTSLVYSVVFSPDGCQILTGSADSTARLWNSATGWELACLKGHTRAVHSVAFSPDGRQVLTGSYDGTARLWDRDTGSERARLKGHNGSLTSVVFSPDGRQVLTRSYDETARLWDRDMGRELICLEGHTSSVTSVAFSPDGYQVLTGSEDETALLWDSATGRKMACLEGHTGSVTSVAFSPDGRKVLTGSEDETARLWDSSTGRELARLKGHDGEITSVAFSPDGYQVLTGSVDGTALLWDSATGRELLRLEKHTGSVNNVAFSPNGHLVLTNSTDGATRLWDSGTGRELTRLEGHTGWVSSVAFSPNGHLVLTGSDDGTARLWDSSTEQELARLEGHTGSLTSVAFSPDGHLAITCDGNGRVLFWNLSLPKDKRLCGLYVTYYDLGAIYWEDAAHLVLVDTGGSQGWPHFYYLTLEGIDREDNKIP